MKSKMNIYKKLASSHPKLSRGQVWCLKCGKTLRINSQKCLSTGWPQCCGETMTIDQQRANNMNITLDENKIKSNKD